MELKMYQLTIMDELLYSHCRQSNHFIATKYHLWWLHKLLTGNKLDSEYVHLVVKTNKLLYLFVYTVAPLFQ